ncbi:hypothetical protein SDC9_155753 [bioreactor metagenome]|uniref:Uncharacterized protein n=1 Tax=bioreactor metagenome TaxID=1076179 RepID=A0A645F2I9_9ZZZZ
MVEGRPDVDGFKALDPFQKLIGKIGMAADHVEFLGA